MGLHESLRRKQWCVLSIGGKESQVRKATRSCGEGTVRLVRRRLLGWLASEIRLRNPTALCFHGRSKNGRRIASELHVVCMNVVSFVHPNAIGVCLSSSFNDVVIIDINAIGCRPAARQRAQCNQLQQEKHSGSTAPRFAYRGLYLADPTDKSVRATPLA